MQKVVLKKHMFDVDFVYTYIQMNESKQLLC